ncbi:MAG: aminotransferase class IV [Gammaproteobacteria bacterium]
MGERKVYLNGQYLPESAANISFRDAGFVFGDAVFDTARTFKGELFRLDAHLDRLYATLDYARIDPELTKRDLAGITEQVVAMNRRLLDPNDDYWVSQRISRGNTPVDGEPAVREGPTVVVECTPLPLRGRARFYLDGIDAVIPARVRVAPEALSPNAKTNNYMNMMLAQREVSAVAPGAWALMRDRDGNLAEGPGCNVFLVTDGELTTPTTEFVLPGISREIALELARGAGLSVREQSISPAAAKRADEAFFTSTSLCICPMRSLDARVFPAGVPGPVTRRLMQGFSELVGMDYVEQYTRYATERAALAGI